MIQSTERASNDMFFVYKSFTLDLLTQLIRILNEVNGFLFPGNCFGYLNVLKCPYIGII